MIEIKVTYTEKKLKYKKIQIGFSTAHLILDHSNCKMFALHHIQNTLESKHSIDALDQILKDQNEYPSCFITLARATFNTAEFEKLIRDNFIVIYWNKVPLGYSSNGKIQQHILLLNTYNRAYTIQYIKSINQEYRRFYKPGNQVNVPEERHLGVVCGEDIYLLVDKDVIKKKAGDFVKIDKT